MNFHFNKLILWLRAGGKRVLTFQPNKVNVITGGSNTGKTAILQIIDYCLFASHSKIAESVINENVSWYGINIQINEKNYTICRSALSEGRVTQGYYFSSSGSIPEHPEAEADESTIKSLLEAEFCIDRKVAIPFGGKLLKAGSRISLRYFLLFTTISEDIITNSSVYFDKQDNARYREALPRIFDLAVGIDNIENILAREKRASLESEVKKLERKQNRILMKGDDFHNELRDLIRRAKEFGLVDPDLNIKEATSKLRESIADLAGTPTDKASDEYNKLNSEVYRQNRIIRNLKKLKQEYSSYKDALRDVEDSIKPIIYLSEKKEDLVKTSIYEDIVAALEADLRSIKNDIKDRTPIDVNVSDIIRDHEQHLLAIRDRLAELPQTSASFKDDKEKYLFLGEVKAKLELYREASQAGSDDIQTLLDDLQYQLDGLHVRDSSESRDMFIKLLEEIIQKYINVVGGVMENYEKYHPVFDYTRKVLLLRKPLTDFIENVGSSSNHMFMHLFLFLGLHEAIKRKNVPFVPSYLIVDQPSRPYWGGEGELRKEHLDRGDEVKIRKAFELLNYFMEIMLSQLEGQFQLIVFEHVPPSTWAELGHIHLVEEFVGDNALIPKSYLRGESGETE